VFLEIFLLTFYIFSTFSWGRWEEVIKHAHLRKGFTAQNVEEAVRMTLLYSVNTYKGDEKIKTFVWDLITPREYGERVGKNHSGLSDPVPRGRKAKKAQARREAALAAGGSAAGFMPDGIAWVSDEKYDIGMYLNEKYRQHLDKHSNKLLLRVRMLYYIQQEILGDHLKTINKPGVTLA
jgi:chromodomain-helicase-DNA-binding protein 7